MRSTQRRVFPAALPPPGRVADPEVDALDRGQRDRDGALEHDAVVRVEVVAKGGREDRHRAVPRLVEASVADRIVAAAVHVFDRLPDEGELGPVGESEVEVPPIALAEPEPPPDAGHHAVVPGAGLGEFAEVGADLIGLPLAVHAAADVQPFPKSVVAREAEARAGAHQDGRVDVDVAFVVRGERAGEQQGVHHSRLRKVRAMAGAYASGWAVRENTS